METLERHFSSPRTELEKDIAKLGPWFHNIHLPDGTQTAPEHPLGDFPQYKWNELKPHIGQDLQGKRVLDIGCNAGFYCFELAKAGAQVLGIDCNEHYLEQGRWVRDMMGYGRDQVDFKKMDVYDLHHLHKGFDLVLFLGVFYHLRYPLLGLDIVASITNATMAFQTLTMPFGESADFPDDIGIDQRDLFNNPDWPKMAFIEKRLQGDPTNWWAANPPAVEAMLRSAGFGSIEFVAPEVWICREPSRGASCLQEVFD